MRQAYGFSGPLYYGKTKILSETGLHQGDPLASLAFSLAIHPIIREVSSPFSAWYLDDGTFGGGLEEVLGDLGELERRFAQIGLSLNRNKCEVSILISTPSIPHEDILARVRQVMPGITHTPSDRLTLLGAPLDVGGLEDALALCSRKVELICDRVQTLDSHWALFFLTRYASAPRLSHLLRSSPAYLRPALLHSIDTLVRDALVKCCNVNLSESAWRQATLPTRMGGLGVRSVADLALPCFMSSVHSALGLMRRIYAPVDGPAVPEVLASAVAAFGTRFPDYDSPDGEAAGRQRTWDSIACESRFADMLEPANQVQRARLLAAKEPNSGAWLRAVPLPSLGLHLDDTTVQVAVALRVGATICEPHVCRCGHRVDVLGHHGLSCQYSRGRLPRHANLNDVVKRALATAGIPSWLEPVGLHRTDRRKPDGVTVFPYSRGRCLTWDATCVDTFASTSVVGGAVAPGSAAAAAEARKRERYRGLTDRYRFEPVAIETTGVLGPSTTAFVRELGLRVSAVTGEKRETEWLIQRLALAVVRGNAASVLATGCTVAQY